MNKFVLSYVCKKKKKKEIQLTKASAPLYGVRVKVLVNVLI